MLVVSPPSPDRRVRPLLTRSFVALWSATIVQLAACRPAPPDEAPDSAMAAAASPAAQAGSAAEARRDSLLRARPGYIVDSILPLEEEVRRFTANLAYRPESLANGAPSRTALVQRWVRALERRDSTTLIRMAINRPEFALLVYPESPYARPPYRQSPRVVWDRLSVGSLQGFRRTLERLGGQPLGYVGYRCPRPVEALGASRVWSRCEILRVVPGRTDTVASRLFGSIIEHHGHFKFLSLEADW
jgi:hypothetical protein